MVIATHRQPLYNLAEMSLQALKIKKYIPGRNSVVVDTLSMSACEQEIEFSTKICFASVDFPNQGIEKFRQKQMENSDRNKIILDLDEDNATKTTRLSTRRDYLINNNGMLY